MISEGFSKTISFVVVFRRETWNCTVVEYTYFKKGCQRERLMAIVEGRLYDRKELWVLNIDGK